jgi:hypothetical protein
MTAREKFNLSIESNRKELNTIKKTGIYSTLSLVTVLIAINTQSVFFSHSHRLSLIISLIVLAFALASGIPIFIISYKAEKARKKLVCPKCNTSLDYLLMSNDYNPKRDFTAFPSSISNCPFCKINLDDKID